jgi:hypothetical protein
MKKTKRVVKKIRKTKKRLRKKVIKGGKKAVYSTNSFSNAIEYIKALLITNNVPHEICGSIAIDNSSSKKYTVLTHETSSPDQTRASCVYDDNNDPVIWHNHPATSKFYPSIEDMLKPFKVKNRRIGTSLIFSHIGYWRLNVINHMDASKELVASIQKWLDRFYFRTEHGRVYNSEAVIEMTHNLNNVLENIMTIEFNLYG